MVPPVEIPSDAAPSLGSEDPLNNTGVAEAGNSPTSRRPNNRSIEAWPTGPQSQEQALVQDDTTIFPPGVDPRRSLSNDHKPPTGSGLSPLEIFSFIGISSSCSATSCQVKAVQPASLADRSGIRSGDVIVAINNDPIDPSGKLTGEVNVRSLRVVREGKTIVISLIPR
jgi:hypothetical protein